MTRSFWKISAEALVRILLKISAYAAILTTYNFCTIPAFKWNIFTSLSPNLTRILFLSLWSFGFGETVFLMKNKFKKFISLIITVSSQWQRVLPHLISSPELSSWRATWQLNGSNQNCFFFRSAETTSAFSFVPFFCGYSSQWNGEKNCGLPRLI